MGAGKRHSTNAATQPVEYRRDGTQITNYLMVKTAFLKLKVSVGIYRESPPSQYRILIWYLKSCHIAVACVSVTHPLTLCFSEADELFNIEICEKATPWWSQNFAVCRPDNRDPLEILCILG